MPTLTFNNTSYTVDHAIKGADYIHGYDANGTECVCFDGIVDFAAFSYDSVFLTPTSCLEEHCNDMRYVGGVVKNANGDTIPLARRSDVGLVSSVTTFNQDGTITETAADKTTVTTFNQDGSITEVLTYANGSVVTVVTTFNQDGSITKVIS